MSFCQFLLRHVILTELTLRLILYYSFIFVLLLTKNSSFISIANAFFCSFALIRFFILLSSHVSMHLNYKYNCKLVFNSLAVFFSLCQYISALQKPRPIWMCNEISLLYHSINKIAIFFLLYRIPSSRVRLLLFMATHDIIIDFFSCNCNIVIVYNFPSLISSENLLNKFGNKLFSHSLIVCPTWLILAT